MKPFHFTTTTGTPGLTLVNGGVPTGFRGAVASNAETTATIYLKLWWQHNGPIPIIGTTPPDCTIPIPTAGLALNLTEALQGGGPLYVAVTLLAADTDDSGLTAGGEVVTLFLA